MKIVFLILTIIFAANVRAYSDCSFRQDENIPTSLEELLRKKGYFPSPDGRLKIEVKQKEAIEPYILIGEGRVRILRRTTGTYTVISIRNDNNLIADGYGEASSTFLRSDDYRPTRRNQRRSMRRSIKDLNQKLIDCP